MAQPANRWWKPLLAACLAVSLGGCGFQLRGSATLPFDSMFIDLTGHTSLGAEIRRNLRAGTNTRVVEKREDAQAIMQSGGEGRSKVILSLGNNGAVREFRLIYTFAWRVVDQKGVDLIDPVQMKMERDYSFNDSQVLSKETEEGLLYRDMQSDMVQQVVRRLAAAKLRTASGEPAP